MKKSDRYIWGIFLSLIGLFIIIFNELLSIPLDASLIFGLPLLVIGIIVMLNKSEDTIENRKDINQNK